MTRGGAKAKAGSRTRTTYNAEPPGGDLSPAFARAHAAASRLPDVDVASWFGTPALKVHGKSLMRVKDRDTLVLMCPLGEKALLMETAPDIYFETDHYKGWPAVLVRLSKIDDVELALRLERAWRLQAPKRLARAYDTEKG